MERGLIGMFSEAGTEGTVHEDQVRNCLQTLELGEGASMEAIRRAYKDLVRVWHPDRFSGDPGLRRRAEEKSKRLNVAYETLVRHFEHTPGKGSGDALGGNAVSSAPCGTTEAFFEAGTRAVLILWHSLGRAVRTTVKEAGAEGEYRKRRKSSP